MLRERRKYRRYEIAAELKGMILTSFASGVTAGPAEAEIRGRVTNVSSGGLCLHALQAMEVAAPFRCEIKIAEFPVGIPTLVQVRWIEADSRGGCRVGLQFVL